MKKLIIPVFLLFGVMPIFSQPVVYFNFLTHDEDTGPWNAPNYYLADRAKLITLANYFQTNGITLNMQSDWLYLTNVIAKDTGSILSSTSGKNILRWMVEDKGVEMDPHSHETTYIYPDIAKLMDSLGLPESKVMGGTLYGQMNGTNIWTNLSNGQYGVVFPNYFWHPDYVMGGGSPGHVADLNYYGFWNPQDTANYLVHDTTQHIRHIGVGCDIKIKDTSSVAVIVAELKDVVEKVQSGQYPSHGFYVQTIFFGHGDLNNNPFYNKLLEIADSANAIVGTGAAQWKTLKQAYTEWETTYNAQMFQWECGQVLMDIKEQGLEKGTLFYPNPFTSTARLQTRHALKNASIILYNSVGQEMKRMENLSGNSFTIESDALSSGLYFLHLFEGGESYSVVKIVVGGVE